MVEKKKDFTTLTKKALDRPESMSDFLDNGNQQQGRAVEKKDAKAKETPGKQKSAKPKPGDTKIENPIKTEPDTSSSASETEDSLNLSEQTTFYLDLQVCNILDTLWLKLRQKAPKGQKKRISKSLIVNRMVEFCNETLEREGLEDSGLAKMILEK